MPGRLGHVAWGLFISDWPAGAPSHAPPPSLPESWPGFVDGGQEQLPPGSSCPSCLLDACRTSCTCLYAFSSSNNVFERFLLFIQIPSYLLRLASARFDEGWGWKGRNKLGSDLRPHQVRVSIHSSRLWDLPDFPGGPGWEDSVRGLGVRETTAGILARAQDPGSGQRHGCPAAWLTLFPELVAGGSAPT